MRTSLLGVCLALSLSAPAQRSLSIRGNVHLPEDREGSCTVTLMTVCGDTLVTERVANGRFHYRVPRNAGYVLRFERPTSVTKEMVVDADDLPRVRRTHAVRRIRFNVLMEDGDPAEHWRYAQPVGYSSFKRGSTMRVSYDPIAEAEVDEW